jgi:circadian clock protein KaiC
VYSLVQWFKNQGVTAMLTAEIGQMFGTDLVLTGRGISHIADNLIALRYVPIGREVRRAITVLSTRGSAHSNEVREYRISEKWGPQIGDPISGAFSLFERQS